MSEIHGILRQAIDGTVPLTDDDHDALLRWDRRLYASMLRLPGLAAETRMGVVIRLLAVTENAEGAAIAAAGRRREDRLIAGALAELPAAAAIAGFAELARRRVNNQRTSGCVRSYLFGSPELESWSVKHRRALRRILRHAMGRPVSQSCLHLLQRSPSELVDRQRRYLRKHLFRYGDDEGRLREIFCFLFGKLERKEARAPLISAYLAAAEDLNAGAGLPYRCLQGLAATYHRQAPRYLVHRIGRRDKVKRHIGETGDTADAPLIGLLRQYLESRDSELLARIDDECEVAARDLPACDVRVAVVIDASVSMLGVGHRLYNNMAIAIAVYEVIRRRAAETRPLWIGGREVAGRYPQPSGPTDLASALLAAVAPGIGSAAPDAVVVVSDGYENVEQGDARAVLRGLDELAMSVPIVHVLPAFTVREHIAGRKPLGDERPLFVETAQSGFLPLWLRLRAAVEPEKLPQLLRQVLEGPDAAAASEDVGAGR